MATLKANPKLSRQLTLEGPMLLWRDKAGGGREGLLLTTDVCENLNCSTRHLGVHALWVQEGLGQPQPDDDHYEEPPRDE